jgi:hypothetical protein
MSFDEAERWVRLMHKQGWEATATFAPEPSLEEEEEIDWIYGIVAYDPTTRLAHTFTTGSDVEVALGIAA